MEIDLFTVGAQVVNFVVLVALLRRFLYGPVIRAMAERERRIASTLEEAATARRAAEAEAEAARAHRAELDAAREGMLAEARAEAEGQRGQWLADAREDVRRQRERWHEAVEQEKAESLEELQRRLVERVWGISRRALRSLADEDLEHAIARAFLRRLEALDHDAWNPVRKRDEDEAPPSILVTSAFALPPDVRAAVGEQVRERAGMDAVIRYEVHPETIAGVELRVDGLRTAWSLGDFVDSLEEVFPATGSVPAGEPAR